MATGCKAQSTQDAGHVRANLNVFPLMLFACSVDTPIHINRSHLLAWHCTSHPASCVDWALFLEFCWNCGKFRSKPLRTTGTFRLMPQSTEIPCAVILLHFCPKHVLDISAAAGVLGLTAYTLCGNKDNT